MWVPFRVVIGADSEAASGDLYMQSALPREDFDRLVSDIASDRVEELCLSCRTDLWVRSPTLSPQIWYMAPGKIGKGMIDEIWWSKSYETDIREAKEVAAEPQTQPAKPQPAKSASRLAAFILIGMFALVVCVTYFGWQWLSLRR